MIASPRPTTLDCSHAPLPQQRRSLALRPRTAQVHVPAEQAATLQCASGGGAAALRCRSEHKRSDFSARFPPPQLGPLSGSPRRVALRGRRSDPARLIPAGMVVSTQCIKDCIKKDMIDPFTEPPASCTLRRLALPSAALPYLPPPSPAAMRALCPTVMPGRGAGEAAREGHHHAARRGHRLRIQDRRKGAPGALVGRLSSTRPRVETHTRANWP